MNPREITLEEQAEIRRVFTYDPETGAFFHSVDRGRSQRYKAGDVIDNVPNNTHGYIVLWAGKRAYLAHRIAWFLQTGIWPSDIDHLDHNRTNNRFSNLREVSHQENMKNMTLYKSNNSGVSGICIAGRNKDRWRVTVNIGGKQTYLGEYKDFDVAVSVRENARIQQGYHVNHGQPTLRANHV